MAGRMYEQATIRWAENVLAALARRTTGAGPEAG